MKNRLIRIMMISTLSVSLISQNVMAGPGLPDIGELTSEAAEGIADAAGKAGELISVWGEKAGETADQVKKSLSDAGVKIQNTASELGQATAGKAGELTDKAGDSVDKAIDAVKGAGDLVVDQAGHVVDLAAAGAGYISESALNAFRVLKEQGTILMGIAQEAAADIDLSDQQNWETAKSTVIEAVRHAYSTGILDGKYDENTVQIVTNVIFGTMMYTAQYNNEAITLSEYAGSMSEMLIKEGLPAGVGFIVKLLVGNMSTESAGKQIGNIAKEVTYYLISQAYGDKSGEEIESEEEALMGLGLRGRDREQ